MSNTNTANPGFAVSVQASVFDGEGTALFSSGSAPDYRSDAVLGQASGLFSSGSVASDTPQNHGRGPARLTAARG
ncbi:DUF6749 family protein [Sedimentitalea nanhaiensis]|uniref:Uncharacterized protein n=1 Tax=Sedimentitalea nanhaiensis TaxID=999627 RepID=A0A1I7ALJ2_9RHOB|nr:DUF6749 family protein [Sedimentitalea nanhaiensis]SFT75819.1 hypothetical protein SAMN05216236_10742 [Sedimentitalea nanhaiensis]